MVFVVVGVVGFMVFVLLVVVFIFVICLFLVVGVVIGFGWFFGLKVEFFVFVWRVEFFVVLVDYFGSFDVFFVYGVEG